MSKKKKAKPITSAGITSAEELTLMMLVGKRQEIQGNIDEVDAAIEAYTRLLAAKNGMPAKGSFAFAGQPGSFALVLKPPSPPEPQEPEKKERPNGNGEEPGAGSEA